MNSIESNFPDLKKWWEYDRDSLMSFIYWMQNQIPPSDKQNYEKNWHSIKKQLIKKYGDKGEGKECMESLIRD